jgi:HSP20 family protein
MPSDDFLSQFHRLTGEFDQLFADLISGPRGGRTDAVRAPADVFLTDDPPTLTVQLDAAGVDPAAIEVVLDGQVLVVRGERTRPRGVRRSYQHAEIAWGPFERRLRIGVAVDADAVEAAYDRGLLTITLPIVRRAPEPRRAIDVRTQRP